MLVNITTEKNKNVKCIYGEKQKIKMPLKLPLRSEYFLAGLKDGGASRDE